MAGEDFHAQALVGPVLCMRQGEELDFLAGHGARQPRAAAAERQRERAEANAFAVPPNRLRGTGSNRMIAPRVGGSIRNSPGGYASAAPSRMKSRSSKRSTASAPPKVVGAKHTNQMRSTRSPNRAGPRHLRAYLVR